MFLFFSSIICHFIYIIIHFYMFTFISVQHLCVIWSRKLDCDSEVSDMYGEVLMGVETDHECFLSPFPEECCRLSPSRLVVCDELYTEMGSVTHSDKPIFCLVIFNWQVKHTVTSTLLLCNISQPLDVVTKNQSPLLNREQGQVFLKLIYSQWCLVTLFIV